MTGWEIPVLVVVERTPPSLNAVGSRGHWSGFHKHKKSWEEELGWLLRDSWPKTPQRQLVRASFVWVDAVMRFPKPRRGGVPRRDEGNFRSIPEKALGDALQAVGVLADDDHRSFRFGQLGFDSEFGHAQTRLRIAWKRATS